MVTVVHKTLPNKIQLGPRFVLCKIKMLHNNRHWMATIDRHVVPQPSRAHKIILHWGEDGVVVGGGGVNAAAQVEDRTGSKGIINLPWMTENAPICGNMHWRAYSMQMDKLKGLIKWMQITRLQNVKSTTITTEDDEGEQKSGWKFTFHNYYYYYRILRLLHVPRQWRW